MAQEIVTWCDVHLERDEKVIAAPVVIALNGNQPKQLDLCDDCHKTIMSELLDTFDTFGRRYVPGKTPAPPLKRRKTRSDAGQPPLPAADKIACPMDGCESTHRSREAMRQHLMTRHDGIQLPVVEGPLGTTVDGTPLEHYCDQCEAGYVNRSGLTSHISRAH